MTGFAQAMTPKGPAQSRPQMQAQNAPQNVSISPYAQSLFGSLVTQPDGGGPQMGGQQQQPFPMLEQTPQQQPEQQQPNPILPYIGMLAQLPGLMRPGMRSPLAQVLSQILAQQVNLA